jgi:hypothetical protein
MVAGQIFEKLFALFAATPPSGDCAKRNANGFDATWAQ